MSFINRFELRRTEGRLKTHSLCSGRWKAKQDASKLLKLVSIIVGRCSGNARDAVAGIVALVRMTVVGAGEGVVVISPKKKT